MPDQKPLSEFTRRTFLRLSISAAAGAGLTKNSDPPHCLPGVAADEGPFFPIGPIPSLTDLTRVPDREGRAQGQLLYVFGQVTDPSCRPLPGAKLVVWQADQNGLYRHPRAESLENLDPNFMYFGQMRTDQDGCYMFKTIEPRWYRFLGIDRAPHIHFHVSHAHQGELTTEMYFQGEEDDRLRMADGVFRSRNARDRDRIIVPRESSSAYPDLSPDEPVEESALCCHFNITIP